MRAAASLERGQSAGQLATAGRVCRHGDAVGGDLPLPRAAVCRRGSGAAPLRGRALQQALAPLAAAAGGPVATARGVRGQIIAIENGLIVFCAALWRVDGLRAGRRRAAEGVQAVGGVAAMSDSWRRIAAASKAGAARRRRARRQRGRGGDCCGRVLACALAAGALTWKPGPAAAAGAPAGGHTCSAGAGGRRSGVWAGG